VSEPIERWIEAVSAAERRGEPLLAFDLAERGLEEHPDATWLRHRAVLALARSGSTFEAERRFAAYELATVDDEDVQALRARIAKDIALASSGAQRRRSAARAAALYRAIYERTHGYYPGVNSATMLLVAGAVGDAHSMAEEALARVGREDPPSYYSAATEAESLLVLGRPEAARDALHRAAQLNGGDHAALATTRRQLRLVCQVTGIDGAVLAEIAGPPVVHYCGHRIQDGAGSRFPASAEQVVAARIAEVLEGDRPGFAYGSLSSGADIMWAEALLERGAELHVVLPYATDEFVRTSVADSGGRWVERFHRCLGAAAAVTHATDDAYLGDDVLYSYASELAMGLALLRGRFVDSSVRQLAVWDGIAASGVAGTAADVATWTSRGHDVTVVAPGDGGGPPGAQPTEPAPSGRVIRAMIFADVKGFSKLTDEQLPRFNEEVLGRLAHVLDRHSEAIGHRNSWGDAIYAVLSDVTSAAACALDLQAAVRSIDLVASRLPPHLGLRLGAHVGPVFPVQDPIFGGRAYMGAHVSRTARIEPVTPPGAVYVTEPFAAALTLAHSRSSCEYVGHIPAAKEYGRMRMYRLWERAEAVDA
jgi:class 3 adenylate cyclase/tetratricopeptide (TPR) repeat protein